jgi:hypothetical protein
LTTSNSAFTAGDPGVISYTCQVKKRKELDMSNQVLGPVIGTKATCIECNRVFNLLNEEDAGEYFFGHDCEVDE